MKENLNDIRLSAHFKLIEFLNLQKYADNIPTMQAVVNLTYGCHLLLEPARKVVGPIIINSGFRCSRVNALVGWLSDLVWQPRRSASGALTMLNHRWKPSCRYLGSWK